MIMSSWVLSQKKNPDCCASAGHSDSNEPTKKKNVYPEKKYYFKVITGPGSQPGSFQRH